jgi:hypothetical protein
MSYDNTNKGIISKNEKKEKDSHPDIKGQINVNGVEYWLDGWMKERNDGTGKFYSLSVKRKENQPKQSNPSHDGARARKLDNDAPF